MTLLLISFLIFTGFVGLTTLKFGVIKSISDSYYVMNHKPLFTLALWGFALPVVFLAQTGLLFFAGAFILFVGAAPEFRSNLVKDVHFVCAVAGIVLGMLSMGFDFGYWWIVAVMAIGSLVIRFTLKFYTWYIEVLAFYLIMLGILLNLIKL